MSKELSPETIRELIRVCKEALEHSYAPYSHFYVAAALLCRDGSIYIGNNIENASYSATVCAERTAFFHAVKDGKRAFDAIVVCGGPGGTADGCCAPCGVCRQVMREFCNPHEFTVILPVNEEEYQTYTLEQLLPQSFGPENLGL